MIVHLIDEYLRLQYTYSVSLSLGHSVLRQLLERSRPIAVSDKFSPIFESAMTTFTKIVLYTDSHGRSQFREEQVALPEGTPQAMLSELQPSSGYQLRHSPIGFRSDFHCTTVPQFVFILSGGMEIGLQDGTSRTFKPGQHFYSTDLLPKMEIFNPTIHGHWSRQVGGDALVTLFLRG